MLRYNPYARQVIAEIGIDISTHHSKSVDDFLDMQKKPAPFSPVGKNLFIKDSKTLLPLMEREMIKWANVS